MTHQCYGCKKYVNMTDLRYECMCTEHKGVCKQCIADKVQIKIPPEHNLQKLHDTTPEYEKYLKRIFDAVGQWQRAYPVEGGTKFISQSDFSDPKTIKEIVMPLPPQMCTCCQNGTH